MPGLSQIPEGQQMPDAQCWGGVYQRGGGLGRKQGALLAQGIVCRGREEEEASVALDSDEQTEWGHSSRKRNAQIWGTSLGLVAWGQCQRPAEGSLQSRRGACVEDPWSSRVWDFKA